MPNYTTNWSGLMQALTDIVTSLGGGGGGGATAANQATGNASLAAIDGKLPTALASDRLKVESVTKFNQFAAEPQLTAVGNTQALDVTPYRNITCQYVVAAINTSITVRQEGSNDGTNWFNLSSIGADTTITTNGVYSFVLSDISLYRTRFNFVSETGGTAATIDVRFTAN